MGEAIVAMRDFVLSIACVLGMGVLASCAAPAAPTSASITQKTSPEAAPPVATESNPVAQTSSAASIVAQQNHRVAGLKLFAARGSAELRWRDDKGDHFEQAQVDLAWRKGGQEISLRADKMGERLAWAGANATSWWLFEPKHEPSLLWHGARNRPVPDSLLPFAGPDALLELLAALPWPDSIALAQDHPGSITAEFARVPRGEWVRTRIQVDTANGLPIHIWLLDAKGQALAESELTQPVMALMDHLPMADRPMVASRVTLKSISNVGTWQIFWDEPGAREDRLKDRLFDLEVLRSVMLPTETVDLEKAPAKR